MFISPQSFVHVLFVWAYACFYSDFGPLFLTYFRLFFQMSTQPSIEPDRYEIGREFDPTDEMHERDF